MEQLSRATDLLKQAVALDPDPRALVLYNDALALLFAVVKAEKNSDRRAKWTAHMQQYLTRAEELKQELDLAALAPVAAVNLPVPVPVPPGQAHDLAAAHPAWTWAIQEIFRSFARGASSLGLAEINELNRASGDVEISPEVFATLPVQYECDPMGRLLQNGLQAIFLEIAGSDPGELNRILVSVSTARARASDIRYGSQT